VLKGPSVVESLTQHFKQKVKEGLRVTCVRMSEFSIVIGTTLGYLFVFERDTEKLHGHFKFPSSSQNDELQNTVTALDVHPMRGEYAVAGLNRGHIALVDMTRLPQNP
jgi:hypothetical protein